MKVIHANLFHSLHSSLISSAPSAPPENVTAYNTSSVSIIVFWAQIPKPHRNGLVLGYKVCYKRADTSNSVLYCTAVFALGIELGGLKPFTPYWITVLGYTNKGEGPTSEPIQVWTDEFGECTPTNYKLNVFNLLFAACVLQAFSMETDFLPPGINTRYSLIVWGLMHHVV